ncbi:MAG: hypothetical protein V3V96_06760 [Acidiferrobacterales bacterium]
MSLRPQPTRWFEMLTARDDLTMAAETLAQTHAVELEIHSQTTTRMTIPDLQGRLEEYNRLAQRYQQYWPEADLRAAAIPGLPARVMDNALNELYAWREDADPLIQRLETLRSEHAELALVEEMLAPIDDSKLNLTLIASAGPALATALYVLPPHTRLTQLPAGVIYEQIPTVVNTFFLALGAPDEIAALEQELSAVKGRHLSLPSWLSGDLDDNRKQVTKRLDEIDQETQRLHSEIENLSEKHRLSTALSDIARLDWFLTNVSNLPISENFGWLTGWTSDLGGKTINDSLKRAGVRAVMRFPSSSPIGNDPPLVLRNPWWAKPFELFAGLLGTPGRNEADPSRLLAIIAPLLFGYMFSDVGQGLVLFVGGLILQRRWPFLRLLVAGGLSAMVFGLVFGSVFSREDIISPLWLHPLEHPLPVLIVPMFGGVALLILGLLLNAVEAYWRGDVLTWGRVEAAVLTLYVGLVASVLHFTLGMSMAVTGLLWYVAGSSWESHTGGTSFPTAIAQLLESVMQLAVNTISFARVGAFAMAHAGLSLAIVTIADVSGHPVAGFVVMVLGNMLIIILEGLVVSVQTTRLVLFEFFIRFLHGEGRVFRPLVPPSQRHA